MYCNTFSISAYIYANTRTEPCQCHTNVRMTVLNYPSTQIQNVLRSSQLFQITVIIEHQPCGPWVLMYCPTFGQTPPSCRKPRAQRKARTLTQARSLHPYPSPWVNRSTDSNFPLPWPVPSTQETFGILFTESFGFPVALHIFPNDQHLHSIIPSHTFTSIASKCFQCPGWNSQVPNTKP